MRWPSQIRSDPAKRDNTKYCEFHRDHGHRTDDCIQLRKEIEYLIRRNNIFVVTWPKKGKNKSSTTTSSANPSSAPAALMRNPRNLRRVRRRRRVQLSQKSPPAQHQIRGNIRGTSCIQTSSAGYYHNLFGLRHGGLPTSP